MGTSTPPQPTNPTNYILDGLIGILVGLSILIMLRLDITSALTLMLLVGIWAFDVGLKNMMNINNLTLFADLSFTCFVYVGSKGISLIGVTNNSGNSGLYILVVAFVLLLFWQGNLAASRGLTSSSLRELGHPTKQGGTYIFSALMAFGSVIMVVILQRLGTI